MELETLMRGGAGNGGYRYLLPFAWMLPTYYATPPGKPIPANGAPRIDLSDPDLQARAQRLVNVLYWTAQTYAHINGTNDADTLKVFLAPEFLFRKGGHAIVPAADTGFGAYDHSTRYELTEALYSAINGTPLFENWLILAGSHCSALSTAGAQADLLNTTILIRGRRARRDASVPYVLVEQHYRSRLDDSAVARLAGTDQSVAGRYGLNPSQHMDHMIRWDEMTLGVELGLNHGQQALSNELAHLSRALGPNVPRLDLQLVASCGASIIDPSCAVKDGALILLADGHSSAYPATIEPRFQIGRYDAARGIARPLPADALSFSEVPQDDAHRVDYMQGRYAQAGCRQGVWSCKAKLPMLA